MISRFFEDELLVVEIYLFVHIAPEDQVSRKKIRFPGELGASVDGGMLSSIFEEQGVGIAAGGEVMGAGETFVPEVCFVVHILKPPILHYYTITSK